MLKINCWIIYVLELEDGCWYVGSTTTDAFRKRMKQHWAHPTKGAMWSRAHKPLRVYDVDTYPRELSLSEIARLEDKKTLEVAALNGYHAVRGGGYTQRDPHWPATATLTPTRKQKKRWEVEKAKRELARSARLLR